MYTLKYMNEYTTRIHLFFKIRSGFIIQTAHYEAQQNVCIFAVYIIM